MIIELLDGTRIDIEEIYRVKRLFHRVPSLSFQHDIQSVDGRGGLIVNSSYTNRTISVQFLYDVDAIYGYYLLRDELNAVFAREESFYIIFKREHYKRYKVRLAEQLNIEPSPNMNSFDVEFIMENNYAESTGTSLQLQNTIGWDESLWGFGSIVDYDTKYNYTFDSNDFIVKNIGNQKIDPRESYLKITINGSFASFIQIQNNTTGEVYRFNEPLLSTDILLLDNIRTLKNNVSSFRNTNKKLISLAPGDNSFSITGGAINSVIFDFRFLYK